MASSRKLALSGAVASILFSTLLLMCVIFSAAPESSELLSSPTTSGSKGVHNFFATVAPGGLIHKIPAASGNSALAKAEKKLSSYAYPRFPVFSHSRTSGTPAPKMSLSQIERTLQADAADLVKDAGPSHAAIAINAPLSPINVDNNPMQSKPVTAALATTSTFPVGSPFPSKGARVIYIGGADASPESSEQGQLQQPFDGQQSVVYVGGQSSSLSNSPVYPQIPVVRHAVLGYAPRLPSGVDALDRYPSNSQRLRWDDVNNPSPPDMQQWRPAYRQPPLGDVDHGDSVGENDENQDNTRFARAFRHPSLEQEFQHMEAREHADRQMIRRLRGALQRVQEMSARAYTGAQAADVVLGSAAIRLRGVSAE
jgi:hypothetical protein